MPQSCGESTIERLGMIMTEYTALKLKELNDELDDMILESSNLKELGNYIKLKMIVNSIVDNEILEEGRKQLIKMVDIIFEEER